MVKRNAAHYQQIRELTIVNSRMNNFTLSSQPPVLSLNLSPILAGSARLPPRGFTYYWTLSSKFFSTFPHGTCSLSVLWSYLALDGVYHQLSAALSSNTTLWKSLLILIIAATGLAPSMGLMAPFKMDLNILSLHKIIDFPYTASSTSQDDRRA